MGNRWTVEEIIPELANIIVCLQPRVEATQSIVTSAVDKVIVNNPKNCTDESVPGGADSVSGENRQFCG